MVMWVCATAKLIGLVQLSRHGERIPESSFPWMVREEKQPGELTDRGEQQQFKHGQELRSNYSELFGETYTPHHVYARAIDHPSAIHSLQLQLLALYPSTSSFDINSVSEEQENILLPHISCLRIPHILRRDLLKSGRHMELIDKINALEAQLVQFVQPVDVWTMYNMSEVVTSYVERGVRLEMQSEVVDLALLVHDHVQFNLFYGDRQQHKLGMTPLLIDTLQRFHSLLQGEAIAPIALYSGQDLSLIPFLRGLDIEEIPGSGAFITFELWEEQEGPLVQVKYNGEPITLQRCSSPCALPDFEKAYEKRMYPDEEKWFSKCNKLNPEKPWPWKRMALYAFAFGSMVLLVKMKEKLVERFVKMFKKKVE